MNIKEMLKDFPTDTLEAELQRRKEEIKCPPLQSNIDWGAVIEYVKDVVNEVEDNQGEPKDFEHNLFEMVAVAMYGDDFWKWWNKKI